MGLKLSEVVIGHSSLFGLFAFEDDDSAGLVAYGQMMSTLVELKGGDDIFFEHFFVGAFVAEYLLILVVSCFAVGGFIHSFYTIQ